MRAIKSVLAGLVLLGVTGAASFRAGEAVEIKIGDLAFAPRDVTVRLGDTVTWVNADFIDHTATDSNGAWDVTIAAGQSATLKPTEPGVFSYICRYHPDMTGRLTVTADP